MLDFLCGLTRLKDKGFSEVEAEEVLILLKNDHAKVNSQFNFVTTYLNIVIY